MAVDVDAPAKIDAPRAVLRRLFDDAAGDTRSKVIGIYSFLLVFNAAAWLWAVFAFRHFPVLLGTAFLAYSFGLRHAVDADHMPLSIM
jgi:high-affinity nickel-transport protein